MGNVNKSDQMFKSFVAQMAGQATAIYLQAKAEKQEISQQAFEVHDGLRMDLEDYEANLQTIEDRFNEEVAKYKGWWADARREIRELKAQNASLLAKLTVADVNEMVDELMGPPQGGEA